MPDFDDVYEETGVPPVERFKPLELPKGGPADVFEGRWRKLDPSWLTEAPPKRQWLLERDDGRVGVLPRGKVGMLVAEGGVGKTNALVQLAVSVATGKPWLESFTVPKGAIGNVLLLLGEEDEEEVRRRVFSATQIHSRNQAITRSEIDALHSNLTLVPLAGKPCALIEGADGIVRQTEALESLRKRLDSSTWSLIVIDPLSRFAGADTEKDNAAATAFVQAVESLVSVSGNPTVMLSHHTNKNSRAPGSQNGASAARGATGLTDGVRWVANLDHHGDRKLSCAKLTIPSKSNYSLADGHEVLLTRDAQSGGALRPSTPAEIKAVQASQEKDEKPPSQNGKAVRV